MAETNFIIDLKIELKIPSKGKGKYIISLSDADLYTLQNNQLKTVNLIVDNKPRGAGNGGDKPRGAGNGGDKPRGAGKGGDKPRGAGKGGDKPRGAGKGGDKPRRAVIK